MGADNMGDIEALRDNPGDFPHADMIPPPSFKRVEGPPSILPPTPNTPFIIDATSGNEKSKTPREMGASLAERLTDLSRKLGDVEFKEFVSGLCTDIALERLLGQEDRSANLLDAKREDGDMRRLMQDLRVGGKPVKSIQPASEIRKTG